jgi:hypothetical protein
MEPITREVQLLGVIHDKAQPDLRRCLAAASLLDLREEKATIPAMANMLKWRMNRVRTAVAAGADRGMMRVEKHRTRV